MLLLKSVAKMGCDDDILELDFNKLSEAQRELQNKRDCDCHDDGHPREDD